MAEAIIENPIEASVEPVAEAIIETPIEAVVEPVAEAITEPTEAIIEAIAEPLIEAIVEPNVEAEVEPQVEAIAEQPLELVAEANTEQTEANIEAITEPPIEPVVITEPTEAVAEANTEPIEAIVEANAEPPVEAVVEPLAEAKIEPPVEAVDEPAVEPEVEPVVEAVIEPAVEAITESKPEGPAVTESGAAVEEILTQHSKLELETEPETLIQSGNQPEQETIQEPKNIPIEIKSEPTVPTSSPEDDVVKPEPVAEVDLKPATKKSDFSEFHTSGVQERVQVNNDGNDETVKEEVQASESRLMTSESNESKEVIEDGDVQVTSIKKSEATRTVSKSRQMTTTTTTQVLTSDDIDSKILKEILNFDQDRPDGQLQTCVQATGEDFIKHWGKVVPILILFAALLFSLISFSESF